MVCDTLIRWALPTALVLSACATTSAPPRAAAAPAPSTAPAETPAEEPLPAPAASSSAPAPDAPPPASSSAGPLERTAAAFENAKSLLAKTQGQQVRAAAEIWMANHPGACPTPADLVRDRELDGETNDPWGHAYAIQCDSSAINVSSFGPDGKAGTADDIVVSRQ